MTGRGIAWSCSFGLPAQVSTASGVRMAHRGWMMRHRGFGPAVRETGSTMVSDRSSAASSRDGIRAI